MATPTTDEQVLYPRARVVSFTDTESAGILHQANLGHDPCDPRLPIALASHAFLKWVEQERECREEDGAAPVPDPFPAVAAEWPTELDRPGWGFVLKYGAHRVGVFVVARREESPSEVSYAVPAEWLEPGRVVAVCFACVQVNAPVPNSDAASVLLSGWVGATELTSLRAAQRRAAGSFASVAPPFRPMHELYELVHGPAAEPFVVLPERKKWNQATVLAVCSTAAAILLALSFALYIAWGKGTPGPQRDGDGSAQFAQASDLKKPVIESELRLEAVRGGGVQVVNAAQEFTFSVRAATRHTYGWVHEADAAGVTLQVLLSRNEDGTLAGEYDAKFENIRGWTFFITVLADKEMAPLGSAPGPVSWLTAADLQALQKSATEGDDAAIQKQFDDALRRAGAAPETFTVRFRRVRHE